MAGSGWQFSVTVPSWTQASLEGDENVVFYRVEVKVLPPEADAAPRTRSVLRRYSHFTKLSQRLKEELGNKKMAKLEPPSKNRLTGVNKRPDLVEKRRRELETWLWKLIGDGEIARSQVLNKFLELSDAARLVQRAVPPPQAPRPASHTGSYAWSEGGSSSVHDSSQFSAAASLHSSFDTVPGQSLPPLQRSASDMSHPQHPSRPPSEAPSQPMSRSVSTHTGHADPGSAAFAAAADQHLAAASDTAARAEQGWGGEGNMRLGLKVHQRASVQQHVKLLQRQLDTAAGDLQDAMEAIFTEQRNKRQLAAQLADLQARASEAGILKAAAAQAELEDKVQQQQAASQQLQQQLLEGQAETAQLQSSLTASQQALEASRQEAAQEQQQSVKLQETLERVRTENNSLKSQLSQSQAAAADMQMQLDISQQAVTQEQAKSAQLRQLLTESQAHAQHAEAQLKQSQAQASQQQQQLESSQQTITDMQSRLEAVTQQLSRAQQAEPSANEARTTSRQQDVESTAQAAAAGQDEPSVAPPIEAPQLGTSGQQADDGEAASAAAVDELAAVQAEMAAYRQQVAAADSKARADRKLLAKEVKSLRKQLEEQRQHAAEQEAALAAAEAAIALQDVTNQDTLADPQEPASLHSNAPQDAPLTTSQGQTAAPEATSQSDAGVQTAPPKATDEPEAVLRPEVVEASSQTEGIAEPASPLSQMTQPMADLLTGSLDLPHAGLNPNPAGGEAEQQGADLITGSVSDSPEPSAAAASKAIGDAVGQEAPAEVQIVDKSGTMGGLASTPAQAAAAIHAVDAAEAESQPGAAAASSAADPFPGVPSESLQIAGAQRHALSESMPYAEQSSPPQLSDGSHLLVTDTSQSGAPQRSADGAQTGPESMLVASGGHASGSTQHKSPEGAQADPGLPASAAAYRQLLQEVSALRQRLHECSAEAIEGQALPGQEANPQQSMQLLDTCDGRIQALMAEADFLSQPVMADSIDAAGSKLEGEIRQAFASVLIESGALRQRINALLRDKYEIEVNSKGLQNQPAGQDARGLFQKFRPPGMSFLNNQANGSNSNASDDAQRPAFGQAIGDRFAGFGDRFSKSFRPQQ